MKRSLILSAGLLVLQAPWLGAHGGHETDTVDEKLDLSDQQIAQRIVQLDADLAHRLERIEKDFAEKQKFETELKDERVAFEKKMVAEHQAFLASLKGKKAEDRTKPVSRFRIQQHTARQAYQNQVREKTEAFTRKRFSSMPGTAPLKETVKEEEPAK